MLINVALSFAFYTKWGREGITLTGTDLPDDEELVSAI
jgi:hypothetical protein